jgi:hypothetical protein
VFWLGILGVPFGVLYIYLTEGPQSLILSIYLISRFSPTLAANFAVGIGLALVIGAIWFFLCIWMIRAFHSEQVKEQFFEDTWFGRDFVYGRVDAKIAVMMAVLCFAAFFEKWMLSDPLYNPDKICVHEQRVRR